MATSLLDRLLRVSTNRSKSQTVHLTLQQSRTKQLQLLRPKRRRSHCSFRETLLRGVSLPMQWFFVTSIIYDAVLHFIIRAAFFTLYWSFSAQSNFRFWIGLGFGMDGMLLIFNILIIVFRCKPITANFRPMERITAQCMDSGFALFTPAALVRPKSWAYHMTKTDLKHRTLC